MAKAIGVSTSTISRELRKNCDMRNGTYNYDLAQHKYETRLKQRFGDLEIDTVIGSNHKERLSPSMTGLLLRFGFANFW